MSKSKPRPAPKGKTKPTLAASRKRSVTAALKSPPKKAGPTKVKAKAKPDSQDFFPLPNGTSVQLLANFPTPPEMKGQAGYVHRVGLGPRGTAVVDCGLTVEVPDGFKAVAHLEPSLAGKGLLIDGNVYTGDARIAFRLRNVGREIVPVLHKDRVATLSLEPVYVFDFTE